MRSNVLNRVNIRLNRVYDFSFKSEYMKHFFQNSNYMNWGYWDSTTSNAKEACDNLLDMLLDFIPEKKGEILDVACGGGATTKKILEYYNPAKVTAINISECQLKMASKNAPGCNFLLMDAANLDFKDESKDNMICVEAVFHFKPKEKFFQEAYRVLKPEGRLVLSDIIPYSTSFTGFLRDIFSFKSRKQREEEYRHTYKKAGFNNIIIQDITDNTWNQYKKAMLRTMLKYCKAYEIIPTLIRHFSLRMFMAMKRDMRYYLVSAQKN